VDQLIGVIDLDDDIEMDNRKTGSVQDDIYKWVLGYYVRFYRSKEKNILTVFAFSIVQSLTMFPFVFLAKRIVDTAILNSDTRASSQLTIDGLVGVFHRWASLPNLGAKVGSLCSNRIGELFNCNRMLDECRVLVEQALSQWKLGGRSRR